MRLLILSSGEDHDVMEFIIGTLIGFAIGATGVGGGTLMAPTLVFVWGFSPRTAVATALLFYSIVKVLASGVYFRLHSVYLPFPFSISSSYGH
jgi:uncharacterized membrane protein YfcA